MMFQELPKLLPSPVLSLALLGVRPPRSGQQAPVRFKAGHCCTIQIGKPRPARLRAESSLRPRAENGGSLGTAAGIIDGLDRRGPDSALPGRHHSGTWREI